MEAVVDFCFGASAAMALWAVGFGPLREAVEPIPRWLRAPATAIAALIAVFAAFSALSLSVSLTGLIAVGVWIFAVESRRGREREALYANLERDPEAREAAEKSFAEARADGLV